MAVKYPHPRTFHLYRAWVHYGTVSVVWGTDDYGNVIATPGTMSFFTSRPYGLESNQ